MCTWDDVRLVSKKTRKGKVMGRRRIDRRIDRRKQKNEMVEEEKEENKEHAEEEDRRRWWQWGRFWRWLMKGENAEGVDDDN